MRWIDNHCHLSDGEAADAEIAAARAAGVEALIDVGTDTARSHQTIKNAQRYAGTVWATVGVHPHDATEGVEGIADLMGEAGVVAVGECGLDYHYDNSPRQTQRDVFAQHIGLAHKHNLPLVIHTREAWDDTFAILDSEGMPEHTVFHCFTGGPAEAEAGLARGGWLSISGIVTFKNASELRDAVALTPVDKLMVETDAPYLAPVPKRGAKNEPANLPLVGAQVAATLGIETESFAHIAWETTHKFYRLPDRDE